MKVFLWTLPRNILACFRGKMLLWHAVAIVLTILLVLSGFDQFWFVSTRSQLLRTWMFPAVRIGALVPIVLPIVLIVVGWIAERPGMLRTGWAIGQAEAIGALIAASYKALTGRTHPPHGVDVDLSHVFRFGFLRGGVFWGWPSSHTTIAFAMAVTLFTLLPKQRPVGIVAIGYALYIGVGVSLTIHWFSDFVAGAIFGSLIGVVVGKSFLAVSKETTAVSRTRAMDPQK